MNYTAITQKSCSYAVQAAHFLELVTLHNIDAEMEVNPSHCHYTISASSQYDIVRHTLLAISTKSSSREYRNHAAMQCNFRNFQETCPIRIVSTCFATFSGIYNVLFWNNRRPNLMKEEIAPKTASQSKNTYNVHMSFILNPVRFAGDTPCTCILV